MYTVSHPPNPPQLPASQVDQWSAVSARPQGAYIDPSGSLGRHAVFSSVSKERLEKARKEEADAKRKANRKVRNKRRIVARKRLYAWRMEHDHALPFRLERCGRDLAPNHADVKVHHCPSSGLNRFAGLVTCDNWACPVCSEHKAVTLASEVAAAIAVGTRKGFGHFHLVMTVQHQMLSEGDDRQSLKALEDDLLWAKNATFSGRWAVDLKEQYGLIGHVRVLERPFSENGWHPHIHFVWWCKRELTEAEGRELETRIFERYSSRLRKRARWCSEEHGVRVVLGNPEADKYLADYMAKMARLPADKSAMSDALEVAYTQGKSSVGFSPQDLLAISDGNGDIARFAQLITKGSEPKAQAMAAKLWVEYFHATQHRQLVDWSQGLRELLEVDAEMERMQAAEEAAASESTDEIEIGVITHETWARLMDNVEARVEVEMMGNDPERLRAYLADLGVVFYPTGLIVPKLRKGRAD